MRAPFILIVSALLSLAEAHYYNNPGPSKKTKGHGLVSPSQGLVWPHPKTIVSTPYLLLIDPTRFNLVLKSTYGQCDIATQAKQRYEKSLLFKRCTSGKSAAKQHRARHDLDESFAIGQLFELDIFLTGPCENIPHDNMDESYRIVLSLGDDSPAVRAKSVWGVMRALETLSHLFYPFNATHFAVNQTHIDDAPRFSHRGLLIDTSRHFLPMHSIIETLDAMAYNKMNVLHWHIVDDPSFPFVSRVFPDLSNKGSYDPETHTYSPQDVARVIDEARFRGIRVISEFDTPGHTLSWGAAFPELLTTCYSGTVPNGKLGPMDPTKTSTYTFLEQFFNEVVQVFPDQFLHLGGDEVNFNCWKSNPNVTDFMKRLGIPGDYSKLEEFYIQKLLEIIQRLQKSYIVWQEVFDNGVQVASDTVIHVWKQPQEPELQSVTQRGYHALLSACWYLDYISTGSDWKKYYACDPQRFGGTEQQKALVLGGEACIWGEFVDATNLVSRTWPRASAVAERLWSPADVVDTDAAAPRFEEQRCRMLRRGLHAEPQNGPGFCECDHLL